MTDKCLPELRAAFPNLQPVDCENWSDSSNLYNCIAWAAEDTEKWWWPGGVTRMAVGLGRRFQPSYWPAGVPEEVTMAAFIQAFEALGYTTCAQEDFEPGFKKVALYTKAKKPTHMARQLETGVWTSKLGAGPDIFHRTLECLEGFHYGTVAVILRKAEAV